MVAKLLSSVLMLPAGQHAVGDDDPMSCVWAQARLPRRHGGLGTSSAQVIRSSAYYGSFSLAIPLILEYFRDVGQPSLLCHPSLTVQLSPITTSEPAEAAVRAMCVDGIFAERFTTCYGTYSEHFGAIARRLAELGHDAQLPYNTRICIPRSLLHFIDARLHINTLFLSLSSKTRAGDGSGKNTLTPLPPINFAAQQKHGQKLASNIVKEVEVERFRQAAVTAGANDVVARLDDCRAFGAGAFMDAIPVGRDCTGGYGMRSDHFRTALRRVVGLLPSGVVPTDICLKCKKPLDDKFDKVGATRAGVCGSLTRACCHASWCTNGTYKNKSHNCVADVICEMWVALCGSAASDHKSAFVNGRVSGGNACELPNNTRVDVVLFGAGEKGEDLYIDVSISCVECHVSFESAIKAKEKGKNDFYKGEVEKIPQCKFLPFVIGSAGGFGSCARQVWGLLNMHAKKVQGRDWRHTWSARSFCARWRQSLSVRLMRHTAVSMIERSLPMTRLRALALKVGENDAHAGFREFVAD